MLAFNDDKMKLSFHSPTPMPPPAELTSGVEHVWELAAKIAAGEDVVFITGAGLSVASGVAPYRNSEDAIWSNFVVQWGTQERFRADPEQWWNEFWLRTHEKPEFLFAKPNAGHEAITQVMQRSNAKLITQNIDGLHQKSGVPERKLVEVHGRLGRYKCIEPSCPYATYKSLKIDDIDDFARDGTSMLRGDLSIYVPRCPHCENPLMPQTLLFDEQYQSHGSFNWPLAKAWMRRASALVFVGTSFSVGVTSVALQEGHRAGKSLFNFNVESAVSAAELVDRSAATALGALHSIIGPAEVTLPMLFKGVISATVLRAQLNHSLRGRYSHKVRPRLCWGSTERAISIRSEVKAPAIKALKRQFAVEDGLPEEPEVDRRRSARPRRRR